MEQAEHLKSLTTEGWKEDLVEDSEVGCCAKTWYSSPEEDSEELEAIEGC